MNFNQQYTKNRTVAFSNELFHEKVEVRSVELSEPSVTG